VILGALSTSHKVGLGLTGLAFIVFALTSAFLLPRVRESFPGRGLRTFVVVCFLFFVGMLAAVLVFGRESKAAAEGGGGTEVATSPATTAAGNAVRTIKVSLVDFKIVLPTGTTLSQGKYVFDVSNDGKSPHNLTIKGPENPTVATPTFGPGKSVKLAAALTGGTYEFYCSVPGHKQLGMDVKVTVSQ
jgi:uncharacterized cupredoxin-like copper-binding protein